MYYEIIWWNERKNKKCKGFLKFVEHFSLFIKQYNRIFWSVEKYRKKNPNVVRTKNRRTMFLSKCAVCDSKNLNFIKEPETSG